MKIAYLDCPSGISGDMTLGALVDAGVSLDTLNEAVGSLGLPGCRLVAAEVTKNGFRATQLTVEYEPEHAHRHLSDILKMIEGSKLTAKQKESASKIFQRLGEAEAKVHGCAIEEVHFHEVGAADSIADIVGSAVGWDLLGVERIVASPVPTGMGKVRVAHGTCSIPAPATAELLRGIPLAESSIQAELTTPTGAAILATLVDEFGPLPAMIIERIGHGAGQRELDEQPNILRLFVGTMAEKLESEEDDESECCWMLETNLDDISGELIAYCARRLRRTGALDVFTTAVAMKKNRPGVVLSVLCREAELESLETIIFEETTTLGIRRWPVSRNVLRRKQHTVQTQWGPVEGKIAWLDESRPRFAPEYESCQEIARQNDVPLSTVYEAARVAFDADAVD
ncbi:MAG: nickel pincer cofactor biosynthesis protein LarC [Pirellulales bacterium]|nr:nickel pincer cofactor biosynthesis protein LarC [Pirellulales bacterium]